ncbi:hypothetical protein CAPTEDRAFT_213629 [Capitella teleta]|uniref:Sphingomyelin phosphodiesterase n=1 Tax=Capitella teleta TaxID=283909 RepID=R7VCP8_CAPTE|nr:hypothetical protein CAPTEDRAFT_213629 [Capitella teleta]|eukprot:ELU16409.1 hypothetical protein CAPTEDRAFT_213629 [Capitella teleta]
MTAHWFFLVLLAGTPWVNGQSGHSLAELELYPIIGRLLDNLPEYLTMMTSDELDVPFWEPEDAIQLQEDLEEVLPLNEDCNTCRAGILALQALVKPGNSYEDLKNLTMQLCYEVVPPYDPDLLCEGALDNYGPHVVYIMNVTSKTPLEICLQINQCYPGDTNETASVVFPSEPNLSDHITNSARSKEDLEGALRVLHITDIHVDEFYSVGAATDCDMPLCCRRNYYGEGYAERWGSYQCNIPYRTLDVYLEQLTALEPDIIIYTGDSPPHTVWLETQAGQLNVSEQTADYFRKYFPGVPAFTSIGNHEMYPTNLYYIDRPEIQELNTEMARYWEDLSGFTEEQLDTMAAAGYYSILVRPGLRVMNWNSNYAPSDNFYNILNDEDAPEYVEMKDYFISELTKARENGEKVLMIGHHPTGSRGTTDYDSFFINNLMAEFGDIIIFYLVGHNHSDELKLYSDLDTLEPRVVAYSGASMTTYTDRNPSAKLFFIDSETFEPLDASAFFINIAEYGGSEKPMVEFTYSYREEYDMEDLSAQSMKDFIDRLGSDPELLWKYRYNANTRFADPGTCDEDCLNRLLCQILNPVHELDRACRSLI